MNFKKNQKIIEKALLIRQVEQKFLELFAKGKLNGTVHTCIGQELVGVCIAEHLTEKDFVLSNHRGHGHFIAFTNEIEGLLGELMGKSNGVSGGFGGSQHLFYRNFISNGIQGGMTPIAAGISLSEKLQNTNNIVVVFIGDGTLGEGIVYEVLNLISIWELPVLLVVENNGYAQSTNNKQTFMGNLQVRIEGFDINFFKSDTWNLEELISESKLAVEYVRGGHPAVIEINTYRLNSHSKGDDNRDKNEIMYYKEKDILTLFEIQENILFQEICRINNNIIETALSKVEKFTNLERIEKTRLVYNSSVNYHNIEIGKEQRINELIYEALKKQLEIHKKTFFLGEDIEYNNEYTPLSYGGAFKVSNDLSKIFKENVRNTPISEAAITGTAIGLALNGYFSIVEIMFGDFLTLAFDQILNHASKFVSMFGKKLEIKMVIRTPMGGKRGYGPTHSQSIEKHFIGIPNLNVIALNSRISPKFIYNNIFNSNTGPFLVIENKVLYTRFINSESITGFKVEQSNELFPTVRISPQNKIPILTVFCYGGLVEEIELAIQTAFDEEDILCEVIIYSQLCPLNIHPIVESVKKTKKLLVIEEGSSFAALSAEIIAQLIEADIKLQKVKRLANNDIIPCAANVEKDLLPNYQSIFNEIKEMVI